MQTKKMSLVNIQGKLSRTEMKQIMAGSGTVGHCWKSGAKCDPNGLKCCTGGCMEEIIGNGKYLCTH